MHDDGLFDPSSSDDGTFVPFTDILFNALLGFAVMVFIAFALIRPDAKTGDIEVNADMIITVSWPDGLPDDIDTYVEDPAGNVVWYHKREAGLVHLDRDDRGTYRDTILVNGQEIAYPLNQETVTIRGIIAGEYVINVYYYLNQSPGTVPVTVKVEKINPEVSVVYFGTVDLVREGQEETVARFTLDTDGNVTGLNSVPKSLIQEIRK
jgi:hypothetical protein